MEKKIFKTTIGGREVSVETGAYCGQANGSCIVRCGDTAVMVNVCMAKEQREGVDFFPLSCDFEEKMYFSLILISITFSSSFVWMLLFELLLLKLEKLN